MSSHKEVPELIRHIGRDIAATDNEIDRLVYNLYGLTESEVKIVENAV